MKNVIIKHLKPIRVRCIGVGRRESGVRSKNNFGTPVFSLLSLDFEERSDEIPLCGIGLRTSD